MLFWVLRWVIRHSRKLAIDLKLKQLLNLELRLLRIIIIIKLKFRITLLKLGRKIKYKIRRIKKRIS